MLVRANTVGIEWKTVERQNRPQSDLGTREQGHHRNGDQASLWSPIYDLSFFFSYLYGAHGDWMSTFDSPTMGSY